MDALLNNVVPILMLIAFGFFLRRQNYFEDVAIQRLTSMVAGILVPCVLFNTFISLNFTAAHVWLAAAFFLLLVLLLSLCFLACRFFPPKRRFFPLFFCCFAFGFMAIPLFSTVFGEENMDYLAAIGLGHELFVGLVFMPVAQLWLKREPASFRSVGKTLFSPLFIMVAAALLLRFTGLKPAVEATVLGRSLLNVISRLGGITTVLIMIIVGYRIRLDDRSKLRESAALVGVRYLFTFGVGYLYKFLVMDRPSLKPPPGFRDAHHFIVRRSYLQQSAFFRQDCCFFLSLCILIQKSACLVSRSHFAKWDKSLALHAAR